MPDAAPRREPGPVLRVLLFTDFDGQPAEPDDVVAHALDGGHVERAEGLVTLPHDENAAPAAPSRPAAPSPPGRTCPRPDVFGDTELRYSIASGVPIRG